MTNLSSTKQFFNEISNIIQVSDDDVQCHKALFMTLESVLYSRTIVDNRINSILNNVTVYDSVTYFNRDKHILNALIKRLDALDALIKEQCSYIRKTMMNAYWNENIA